MSTNGKTLKFRATKLKGFTVYLEDNLRYMNITGVWIYDIDTYLV